MSIPQFDEQLRRVGTTMRRNFTAAELRDSADHSSDPARHLAARWAAKEAVFKAWSSSRLGFGPAVRAVDHAEIEVVSDVIGRPSIRLHGDMARQLQGSRIHVSLTHEDNKAAAVAVIEHL